MTEKQQAYQDKRSTRNHPWRRMNSAIKLTNWKGKPVKPKKQKP